MICWLNAYAAGSACEPAQQVGYSLRSRSWVWKDYGLLCWCHDLDYCDYSCNACGKVCPVGAIPPLELEEKRLQTIGAAYIDEKRCIAWADRIECIVCEEMCPLPEKAITLEIAESTGSEGELLTVPLPRVNRDLCIGCGICEYKCPVNGEAAIRVYTPQNL